MWIRSNSNRFTGMDARMARNPSLTLFVWDRSGPMHLDRASSFRSDYYRLLVVEKCRCVVRRGLRMLQDLDTRIVSRPLSQIGLRMLEKFWLLLQVWSTGYVRVLDFNWRNLILLSSLFADIWYHEWLRCSTCERNLFSIYFSYAQINNRNEFFRIEYFYQKIILFIRKNRYILSISIVRARTTSNRLGHAFFRNFKRSWVLLRYRERGVNVFHSSSPSWWQPSAARDR